MRSVFLHNHFQSQYYSWKNAAKWCLSRTFYFPSMRAQALRKKWDEQNQVKEIFASTVYKKKADKIKSLDLSSCTNEKSEENIDWWDMLWKWQMKHLKWIETDLSHQYDAYIILCFSQLAQDSRLRSEYIERLQINEKLWFEEQELLIKILY